MIAQRFVKRGCVWSFAAIMLLHGAANAAHAGAEMSWSRPHSWNSIRNEGVARQSLDMSCGAAALATLLTHYHGANVTERDVLGVVGLNADYSLTDLANAAAAFGFRSAALSVDIGALERLRAPVILFMDERRGGHFVVLRGDHPSGEVYALADPAWGNVRLVRAQFLQRWRSEGSAENTGRVLLVLKPDQPVNDQFFGESRARRQRFLLP